MDEIEWPVFAFTTNSGELFYAEMFLGNRYNTGDGWLVVLPWGEEHERGGLTRGDNRVTIEPENVTAIERLR